MTSPPGALARNLRAALLGGALAGLLDGIVTTAGTSGQGLRVLVLSIADLGVWGLAALGGVGLWLVLRALLARLPALARREHAPAGTAAVLLAAPLVVYDALLLFAGPRASRIPGHLALSVASAAVGLAAVGLLAWLLARALARKQAAAGPPRGMQPAALLALVAVGVHAADRLLLPRLYPWFHATLGLACVTALVLAVRFALTAPGARAPSRVRLLALPLVLLVCAATGLALLRTSHTLRFVAHERSRLLSLALEVLSLPPPRLSVSARVGGTVDTAPLPPGPLRPQSDVLLITVDALRADHVGAYGYNRPTTPNIDALARRGVRFERAYTQAPHTSFAVTSMLTGKYTPTLARVAVPDGRDTLPFILRRYGWKTAAFYPPAVFYIQGEKLRAYEKSNFHFEYVKVGGFPDAREVDDEVEAFFAKEKPRRAFLWLHYFEPHEKYVKWPGHDFGDRDIDRYDSEIAYVDAAIGKLLDYIARQRPNTIVILTADHGEEFDEHEGRYHGTTLFDEQVRVPLIIYVPDQPPQVVAGPAELVDLAPTILALLDIPPPVRMRGTDLGPWLQSPPAPAERLGLAFAEKDELRMAASARDKLICDTEKGFCSYYDLVADPGERTNLVEQRSERVAELRARLDAWLGENTRFEPAGQAGSPEAPAELPPVLERARLGDPAMAGEVAALLQRGSQLAIRREAARVLAIVLPPRPETRGPLREALADSDPQLGGWAAVAGARLGEPQAVARLAEVVARPETPVSPLQIHAGLALAERRQRAAVPVLTTALAGCTDVPVCRRIVHALGELQDRRATATLVAHLQAVMTRKEAVTALGRLADPAAVPALIERLERDEYVPVRVEAAAALARIGGAPARDALTAALSREQEPRVQAAIRAALSQRP